MGKLFDGLGYYQLQFFRTSDEMFESPRESGAPYQNASVEQGGYQGSHLGDFDRKRNGG